MPYCVLCCAYDCAAVKVGTRIFVMSERRSTHIEVIDSCMDPSGIPLIDNAATGVSNWIQVQLSGRALPGVIDYAAAAVGTKIFMFGGKKSVCGL